MGARGPAPKPTNLRILEGNPSRRPIIDEPQPGGKAKPPRYLRKAARSEWRRLAPTLEAIGLLTKADQAFFAAYCDAVANHAAVSERLDREGMTITDQFGTRKNPLIGVQRNYAETMIRYGGRFGLSPSDRRGIKASAPKEKSKWSGKLTG